MNKEQRTIHFNHLKDQYESQGYKSEEHTMSVFRANVMAILLAGPIACVFAIIFMFVNPDNNEGLLDYSLGFLGLFFVTVVIHELLHGVGWSIFCKNGWDSINFGMIWKAVTPYCTCAEPLNFRSYMMGSSLPLLVLGFGISLLSIVTGSRLLMTLGFFNIICAGGDLAIMVDLLKHRNKLLIDHPTKVGYYAFSKA